MDSKKKKFRLKLPALLQPRVLMQALRAIFSRPYTTDYPNVPYEPPPGFRGRVRFDADACIGCGTARKCVRRSALTWWTMNRPFRPNAR